MDVIKLSEITEAHIKRLTRCSIRSMREDAWEQADRIALTDDEQRHVATITNRLHHDKTSLMNEATIWARAIYPLLMLAEQGDIRAWAQVPLRARFAHVELQGVADGMLASGITGVAERPYLIVVEAKRGLEAQDPRFQLYGQVLAATRLNWENDQQPLQEMYGCYTIIDTWTFIRAEVHDIDSDRPSMAIEMSREYAQKAEAEVILKMLKSIVATHIAAPGEVAHL
jgi:hypothetical protein